MTYTSTNIRTVLLSATIVLAPFIPLSNLDISSKLNEYMEAQVKANRFSGSILVAQKGKVLLAKGYGLARVESNDPNTPATKFRIGPVTYVFTALAILELQEMGKLDVNDSVCIYIPECPDNWRAIKVVNLLTQTSGISDFPEEDRTIVSPAMFAQLLARHKSQPLEFKPGDKLKVSNFGYVVLGAMIERVSGTPFTKYIGEHIWEPLGMRESGYDDVKAVIPGCASGYARAGDRNTFVAATCVDEPTSQRAGGIYSTVEDLYQWDRALHDGKLLSEKSLHQMFTPYRDGYGFGWRILKEFQRKVTVATGRSRGFSNSIRRYTDDDACVIVFSNLEDADTEKISHDLGAIVFGVHYQSLGDPRPVQ
jgi:CubicO group peptidase (beta-lactamase class C family)